MTRFQEGMQNILGYLATLFLSLSGGTVTGPTTFQADVTLNGNVNAAGNANFLGTLNANGAVTFESTETVIGNANFLGTVNANGAATFKSSETVVGNANFLGTVNANGAATLNNGVTVSGGSTLNGNTTFGGYEYVLNGNATFPAVSFAGDHTSGIYYTSGSGGMVNVAIGGVNALAIGNSSNGVSMPFGFNAPANNLSRTISATITGAANNCTFCVDTNSNLGLYKAATNTIGIAANGNQVGAWDPNGLRIGASGGYIRSGNGSPNSNVAGNLGDIYLNTAGGGTTTLYVKETGAGTNTGWVGK